MQLMKSTLDILNIAKHISGKGFKLIYKPDIQGAYGMTKPARKNMPEHLLFYRSTGKGLDWTIAHECGHIIRLFSVDEKDRKIPKSTKERRIATVMQIAGELSFLSQFIPPDILIKNIDIWYDGTIGWLTNMPTDIRIEKWLYDNFPELRSDQEFMLDIIMDEASAVLFPEYREMTPKIFLKAQTCLNYSFAICMDNIFGKNYSAPYDFEVLVEFGECAIELTNIILQEDKGYKQDIEIIDKCAQILEIEEMFEWTDFEDIPPDYLTRGI